MHPDRLSGMRFWLQKEQHVQPHKQHWDVLILLVRGNRCRLNCLFDWNHSMVLCNTNMGHPWWWEVMPLSLSIETFVGWMNLLDQEIRTPCVYCFDNPYDEEHDDKNTTNGICLMWRLQGCLDHYLNTCGFRAWIVFENCQFIQENLTPKRHFELAP